MSPELFADDDPFFLYRAQPASLDEQVMRGLVACSLAPKTNNITIEGEARWWMTHAPSPPQDHAFFNTFKPQFARRKIAASRAGLSDNIVGIEEYGVKGSLDIEYEPQVGHVWSWKSTAQLQESPFEERSFRRRGIAEQGRTYDFFLNPQLGQTFDVFASLAKQFNRQNIQVEGSIVPFWYGITDPSMPKKYAPKQGPIVGVAFRTTEDFAATVHNNTLAFAQQRRELFAGRTAIHSAHKIFDGIAMAESIAGENYIDSRSRLLSRAASQTRQELGIKRHGTAPTDDQLAMIPSVFTQHLAGYCQKKNIDPQNIAWVDRAS